MTAQVSTFRFAGEASGTGGHGYRSPGWSRSDLGHRGLRGSGKTTAEQAVVGLEAILRSGSTGSPRAGKALFFVLPEFVEGSARLILQ